MNGLCQVRVVDTGALDDGDESDCGGSEMSDDSDEGGACAPASRRGRVPGRQYWTAGEDNRLRALCSQDGLSRAQFWDAAKKQLPSRNRQAVDGRLRRLGLVFPRSAEGGDGVKAPTTMAQYAFFTEEEDAQLLAEANSGRHIFMAAVAAGRQIQSASDVLISQAQAPEDAWPLARL